MRHRTLDLNKPQDARIYLAEWEREGMLKFEDGHSVKDLNDEEVIEFAYDLFMYSGRHPPTETRQ